MITFTDVSKKLGGRDVLNGMNLHVVENETFVVVGPSGVGKSVTLKHCVGLMRPDSGSIRIAGNDLTEASSADLENIRELFGYLFQGGALLAWLTVAENVALPLVEKTDMAEDAIRAKVMETLALVGLENDGDKLPGDISGGMRKRAGLARAIIREPRIVLYDEPTSGLDPVSSRAIDNLINDLKETLNTTSVVVTHDLHSALSIGTRIGMLQGGAFVEVSTPDKFIQSENKAVQAFLASQYITTRGSWERKTS